MPGARLVLSAAALLAMAGGSGCASLGVPKPWTQFHPPAKARRQAAVEDFERRRNEAELLAAQNRIDQGDLAAGQSMLAAVLSRDPEHRQARLLQADIDVAQEDFAAAEQTLRSLVRQDPQDPRAHHALALLLETTGRHRQAREHFERASELGSNGRGTRQASSPPSDFAAFSVAEEAADDASHQRGRANVIQAAHSPHARKSLQQALSALDGGEVDVALTIAKQAMDAERQNPQIPLAFSVYLLKHSYADHAAMLLDFSVTRFPGRADIHRALGAAHLLAGNFDEAQVVLQTAVSLDSAHPLSYFLLGQVLGEQDQPKRAAEMLRHAHRLDPRYPY